MKENNQIPKTFGWYIENDLKGLLEKPFGYEWSHKIWTFNGIFTDIGTGHLRGSFTYLDVVEDTSKNREIDITLNRKSLSKMVEFSKEEFEERINPFSDYHSC